MTLSILREYRGRIIGGVMHCFGGSLTEAHAFLDLGFYLSFSGTLTYPKAGPLREVAKKVPLDRILVETDCPYLPPQPWRGKTERTGLRGGHGPAAGRYPGSDPGGGRGPHLGQYPGGLRVGGGSRAGAGSGGQPVNPIAQNLEEVRAAIAAAAQRSGRDPGSVRLVAVSKTVDLERIRAAIDAGQDLFGENYLQEARDKIAALGRQVSWHLVGSLQSNKAREAVELFDLIHAVDRLKLARALDAAAARLGKVQDVLIQVNQAGEATKSGVAPAAAPALLQEVARLPHLRVLGLMTMPPWFPDPEAARPYFRALRELRDHLRGLTGLPLTELSMGMSGDFAVAVEEGATLVRVGTAIFGPAPVIIFRMIRARDAALPANGNL